jgi:predicted nuclease of restriction endonuclease-like (RecB) superfamily
MNFEQLIQSINQTHTFFQNRASKQVDQNLTLRNWLIGYYLVEFEQNGQDRAIYGNKTIPTLAKKMAHVKGLSKRNFFLYKQFYQSYPSIVQTASAQLKDSGLVLLPTNVQTITAQSNEINGLSTEKLLANITFSHFVELIQLDSDLKRRFYELHTIQNSWSVKALDRAINTLLFERTGLSTDKEDVLKSHKDKTPLTAQDIIKSPLILEFLGLKEQTKFSENDLETAIIDHIQDFLMELGHGFCFEARQKRITFDNEHYHIDLVFYHRILHCHILIDLKIGKFSHADGGQMNFYLNYYKDNEMSQADNPPIGLILCANKNDTFVEYTLGGLDNDIFVSKYLIELPKIEELKALIEKDINFTK